jgi:hypothetical protein
LLVSAVERKFHSCKHPRPDLPKSSSGQLVSTAREIEAKIPNNVPYASTSGDVDGLCCSGCHKYLASRKSVLPIDDVNFFLAQPVDWMEPEFIDCEQKGDIICPDCESLIGEYDWNGTWNASGIWIAPVFALYSTSVLDMTLQQNQ